MATTNGTSGKISDTHSSQSILRTLEDEEEDYQELVEKVKTQTFEDWPNEAGFENITEVRGPIELKVEGQIPAWTEGSLYRTGPGTRAVERTPKGTFRISHWFDGFAHTHKFDIIADNNDQYDGTNDNSKGKKYRNIRVMYTSRRQSEEMVANIRKNGDKGFFSFGQKKDPCVGLFGKVMSVYQMATPRRHTSADNIGVVVLPNVPGFKSSYSPRAEEAPATGDNTKTSTTAVMTRGHRTTTTLRNTWLTTDTNCLKEMDPVTLEPIGFATQASLHPLLTGPISCAHAQRDPETGDLFNFNLSLGKQAIYRIFCVSAQTGKTSILATISLRDVPATYIHSFFLSENYLVLCCTSAVLGWHGARVLWEKNVVGALEEGGGGMRWFVVDRRYGRGCVGRFESGKGFFFHSVNSFEMVEEEEGEREEVARDMVDGGEGEVDGDGDEDHGKTGAKKETGKEKEKKIKLHCDVIEYNNLDVIHSLYYDVLTNKDGAGSKFWGDGNHNVDGHCRLTRYQFDVPGPPSAASSSSTANDKTPDHQDDVVQNDIASLPLRKAESLFSIPAPHAGELPTINPRYYTKRHRYVYGLSNRGHSTLIDTISKLDLVTREVRYWNNERGHTPGEAIFVARPTAEGEEEQEDRNEDDGVLLSVVLDGLNEVSYLVCLDARTMVELGRAECGWAIGVGFHGLHDGLYGGRKG